MTDAVTHQPLEKINVCAYATAGGSSCALTDPGGSGEYIIAVEPGEYKIGFSSIEHIYLTQFYNGKATEEEGDLVSVSEGATTSGIDAAMVEGGRISGTVTAANGGAPVKGFDACALQAGGAGSLVSCGLTDTNGEYTIPQLPAGSYKVEFSPGFCFECGLQTYLDQFYSGKESWAEADPVSVNLGATTSGIDVQLIASERLTVTLAGAGAGTVTSSPDGIDCGSKCSHAFAEETAVTLTATPAAGSTFTGWSGGGCSGTETCQVTLNAETDVTATFGKGPPPPPGTHTLAIKLTGTGNGGVEDATGAISCPPTCSHAYVAGTLVTLAAAPAPGSTFAGWSGGGCSGTGACQLTIGADKTLTARFRKVPPTRVHSAHLRIRHVRLKCASRPTSALRPPSLRCAKLIIAAEGTIVKAARGTVSIKVSARIHRRRVTATRRVRIVDARWNTRFALPGVVRNSTAPIYISAHFAGSPGVQPGHAKRRIRLH